MDKNVSSETMKLENANFVSENSSGNVVNNKSDCESYQRSKNLYHPVQRQERIDMVNAAVLKAQQKIGKQNKQVLQMLQLNDECEAKLKSALERSPLSRNAALRVLLEMQL